MLILGLDPGLTRCGAGLVRLSGSKSVQFESVRVFSTKPDVSLADRIRSIGDELAELLDETPPAVIALERVFAQHNVSTVMGTAQISGVVMFLAAQRDIPLCLYTPSEVKAAVTGYGSADKKQVTSMVTKILKLDAPPKPADAADALALAITHAWRSSTPQSAGKTSKASETPAQLAWRAAEQRSRSTRAT